MKIPEELCDYVEALMYECEARKDLCAFMIHHGMRESEGFAKYHDEYLSMAAQYSMAKDMIGKMYANGKNWHLDFDTKELMFDEE